MKKAPLLGLMAGLLPALLVPTAVAQISSPVPVFQLGVFYNLDMDFSPGQPMFMSGKVHCNGTIWMCPQASATFNDIVEATGVVTNKDDPSDQQNLTFNIANLHYNLAGQPLSHVDLLGLPVNGVINPTSPEAMLNLPPSAVAVPYDNAYAASNQIYLYNACDLIISNSIYGTNGNSRYRTNLSVYFSDYYNPTGPLVLVTNDVQWTYTLFTTNVITHVITTNNVTNGYYSFVTNVTFFDFREGKTVQAVQIDVARLGIWLTNHAANGGYQYNQKNLLDKGYGIDSVYVYNSVLPTSSQLPAVRVVNGQQLPSRYGLTVATPMPLYVLGDYNIQTNSGGSQSVLTTNTSWTRPAALMGDSITILSSAWNDNGAAYKAGGSYTARNAVSTTVNTACLEGIVRSTNVAGVKHYSGGLENFLRLMENWSGDTLCYNGSIVAMFPSLYATNYWIGPGTYYDKPARMWSFDVNFLTPSKLPPRTPVIGGHAPVIAIQPQSQTIGYGSNVTFNVTAAGASPLNYQWQFNGTNILAATNASLTVTNVQLGQIGNYAVLVTNFYGSALSSNAVLTVVSLPPIISAQPTNQTAVVNGTAVFGVTVTGSLPLFYQWTFNGTNLNGATHDLLMLFNVQTNQAGNYMVYVVNPFGVTNSVSVVLTVTSVPPTILTQPVDQVTFVGDTVIFNVTASGSLPLSYQWNCNGTNLDGATNAALVLTNVQLSQAGTYAVQVANASGTLPSSDAVLTVNVPTSCVEPPSGLIAWWKGDGNALDSAGTNNGVVQGLTYTNGVVGQAFAGKSSSRVQFADSPAYQLTNALSIECWIRPRADSYTIFWRGDNRPGLDPYVLSMQANHEVRFYIEDESGNSAFVGANLNYNQWYHVAGTWDGETGLMQLYVNGQPVSQTNTTIRPFGVLNPNGNPAVSIGNIVDGDFPFIGDVDEVSLYNRALSADEVAAIYNAGSNGKCALPPTIIAQPADQTVAVGGNATFGVTAVGSQPLSYQWQWNGTNLDSATNAMLTLNAVTEDQAGSYSVQVSNTAGSVVSSNAVLTVLLPPTITTQPVDSTNIAGTSASFNVVADGVDPLSYQWQWNGTNLDGATNTTLTLNPVTLDQAGSYSVTVTNQAGSITSSNAVLSVYPSTATLGQYSFSGDNGFQFQVAGVPGFNYVVQGSTNLIDWVSLFTNTAPFSFTDTNTAGSLQQFYRAIYAP